MSAERSRATSPIVLALVGHAALAVGVFLNDGSRDDVGLALVIVAIAAWAAAFAGAMRSGARLDRGSDRVVWVVAIGSAALAFVRAPGSHVQGGLGVYDGLAGAVAALLATYAFDLAGRASRRASVVVGRRALLFILAFALGAWMLHASPNPLIDTFPLHQQTAQAMLAGKSIYEPGVIHVVDTYKGTSVIPAYVYLPLSAYLTTAAYAVTHDIRWADFMGQLSGAALLWLVAWRCAKDAVEAAGNHERETDAPRLTPGAWADLVTALLLFEPRGLLVLEKAWTEPLALPFLGGFVLLVVARRPKAASLCLGLLCAIKQHLVLYVPFLILAPGVGFTGVAIAGATAIATLVPYLIRAPMDMYRGAFGAIASSPFRDDALAIPAELSRIGVMIPTWVGFAAGLAPLAWLGRAARERRIGALLLGSSLVFALFYVCGRQAFCNYYYLLDATALFAVAALTAVPAATETKARAATERSMDDA